MPVLLCNLIISIIYGNKNGSPMTAHHNYGHSLLPKIETLNGPSIVGLICVPPQRYMLKF